MKELLDAIVTFFDAVGSGPLSDTITGGIHFMNATGGTEMPYCVMTPIAAPATSKYGGVAFSEPQIQFTVRGIGARASYDLLANTSTGLIAKFDEKTFTLATGQNLFTQRLHDPLPEPVDPQSDEDGADTFGWIVTYAFATTR